MRRAGRGSLARTAPANATRCRGIRVGGDADIFHGAVRSRARATAAAGQESRLQDDRWVADDAGAIYRALAPSVLGFLHAERVPDPEDLLGEVFLQVTRDVPRF